MKFRRRDQERAVALLRSSGQLTDVHDVPPDPDPVSLGANGGLGYAWDHNSAAASVYGFGSHADARAAEDKLREPANADQKRIATVNGPLLLCAIASVDDLDALDVIGSLRSAFAGRE